MSLHDYTHGNLGSNSNNNASNSNNNFNSNIQATSVPNSTDVPDMLVDYDAKADQFTPVKFREDIIDKVVSTLTTTKHPNILLTGEAGVGKTAIVEELARLIHTKDPMITAMLDPKDRIYELPISNLTAGSSLAGELEQRVKSVIEYCTDPNNHVILYIDEIHQLFGHDEHTGKIAQVLKPALARGDLRVIASTTTQEARTLKQDPAFNRRFTNIIVPELTDDQTYEILKLVKLDYEKHHHISITDDVLHYVITVADKYARSYQSHRPDTALTVFDQACAITHLANIKLSLNTSIKNAPANVTNKLVDKAGLQLINANINSQIDTDRIKNEFDKHLIGQSKAKAALVNDLAYDNLHLKDHKRPHSYLFAGATGTGKTELAKQLAINLFGDENKMITLNMTEYSSDASLTRLIGSSRGYVGSESNQPLPLDGLTSDPFQIVLLDEFEKAAKDVQRIFMQALDEGYIQLQNEQIVDFSHAIVIATTNAGVSALTKTQVGFNDRPKITQTELVRALAHDFPPELLNRFEHLIIFNPISKDEYKQILKIKYNNLIQSATKLNPSYQLSPQKLDLDTDYDFIDTLAEKSYNKLKNGRPAERTIFKAIAKQLIDNPSNTKFDFTKLDFN